MTREANFERLLTALQCGTPDYVPLVELGIHQKIKEAYLGRPVNTLQDEIDFALAAGYDYVKLQPVINMNPANIQPKGELISTKTAPDTDRVWASEHDGIIQSMEDFERYIWPKKDDISYTRFEEIAPLLPEGIKVIGQYGDIFTMVWEVMGFENFSMALFTDPAIVEALFDKIGGLIFSMFENMATFNYVGALWYSDDIAYASGMIISPTALRKYLFPWMKKIGDVAKKHNLPLIYHSDGVLWDVFEELIAMGVTAIHPIEPKAMDIIEVKRRVAGKLCVIGNIDLGYTLTRGTPEETAEEVKEKLRTVAPGGGYCLGSSNSIPDYVKPENFRAMVDTCKQFGKYPINI
jgi:uroporphyrinogen decarboxylase